MTHPITPPPPHLLKKFSAQAQDKAKNRNGAGYLKTFATLCIEWAMNCQATSNDCQIRSSEIEPSPELIQQWWVNNNEVNCVDELATRAAQWGADQELEACCAWVEREIGHGRQWGDELRAARRPKPPSLKEQALKMLAPTNSPVTPGTPEYRLYEPQVDIIRRALESLPTPQN